MKIPSLIGAAMFCTLMAEGLLIAVMCPHVENYKNDEPVAINLPADLVCQYTATKGVEESEHEVVCHYHQDTYELKHRDLKEKLCPRKLGQ